MPSDDDVTRGETGADPAGDEIRRRFAGAAEPGDPTGAYERVIEKKVARRVRRRIGTVGLAVIVIAGTAGGTYGLTRVFGKGSRQPAAGSTTGFTNGLIAFENDGGIYTARVDGTHVREVTLQPPSASDPAWSADASRIGYQQNVGAPGGLVYTIRPDGTTRRPVVFTRDGSTTQPTWFPDGSGIAYVDSVGPGSSSGDVLLRAQLGSGRDGAVSTILSAGSRCQLLDPAVASNSTIAVLRSCPSPGGRLIQVSDLVTHQLRELPSTSGADAGPAWTPDGHTILFGRAGVLYTVRGDGSNARVLAHVRASNLSYSPDGTKILFQVPTTGGVVAIEVMDADGTHITKLPLPAFATQPSWQPVPIGGVPAPSPTISTATPAPTFAPTPTPTPPDGCPTSGSEVTADFDGDGAQDGAVVSLTRCFIDPTPTGPPPTEWSIFVHWGGGASGSWGLPECSVDTCAVVASIPMNDGTNALVVMTERGASTPMYELLNLPQSEAGPQQYKVIPPGGIGFPAGQPAILPDGGSVTHLDFFRCQGGQYPGGGDQATIVSTSAVLSQDQSTYSVTETILAHGPNAGAPELIVVAQTTHDEAFDAFDPAQDVTGVPCWDQGGFSPSPTPTA
jgi:hypothetical protein